MVGGVGGDGGMFRSLDAADADAGENEPNSSATSRPTLEAAQNGACPPIRAMTSAVLWGMAWA